MKILVASDLHYRLKQFDWLSSQAIKYDAIIIAGDMLDIGSYLDLNTQIIVIQKCLKKISEQIPLLVCSGNHDGNEKNIADEFVAPWIQDLRDQNLHVDGDNVYFGTTLFTIFPWWDGDVAKQEIEEQVNQASQLEFEKWIWVYHGPPDQSPTSWTGKRFIGDLALNKWIKKYQPEVVFTGHIHESPFRQDGKWADQMGKTWVFNSGSYMGDIPPHIVFDTETMCVNWYSLAGEETRQIS